VAEELLTLQTPHHNPVMILTRTDTADGVLAQSILASDEYRLGWISQLDGVALDIGAHIGTVALALLADFPGVRVVAVEPIPDNVDLIQRAGASFIAEGRLTVLPAAAGAPGDDTATISYGYTEARDIDPDYVHQNRFIGGMWRKDAGWEGQTVTVPVVTLRQLAADYSPAGFVLCKIDCEGGEYPFLSDGAELVEVIIGEWHDGGPERIKAILDPTHTVLVLEDHGGTGTFIATRRNGPKTAPRKRGQKRLVTK